MKIRIIGSCGSGKSTLARELSVRLNVPFYEIDNLIWDRSAENLKYPEELRDRNLEAIVNSDEWIVEGVQYKDWTLASIEKADLVVILNPNVYVRDYWIIKRFILSRTGIRPWNYKQSFKNLCKMIVRWNHRYDIQKVKGIVNEYQRAFVIARNKKEVIKEIGRFYRVHAN
jgi:adenylate kinase family enzyme